MHSTPETRAMAREIADFIKSHPERHDQSSWVYVLDANEGAPGAEYAEALKQPDLCNSTMCVAGTALFLEHGTEVFKKEWQMGHDFEDEGASLLGLTYEEANYLFYDTNNEEALDMVEGLAVGEWRGIDV